MLNLNNNSNCTGCCACFSVCPKSAILMTENSEGFLFPKINIKTCIGCELCVKVCPAIKPLTKNNSEIKAFTVINNDEKIRRESSSGGVFSAIAEKIIQKEGIVFGAKFCEDFSVRHSWADNLEGLKAFRGSKYVQSNINNSFKECKQFLDIGKEVLFSGTPCQIQGLKKYLRKEYTNLLTIDFICHGVPSPLLWRKYKEYHENKLMSKISNVTFRNKITGWEHYSVTLTFENKKQYSIINNKDCYMQLFLKDLALRESCYNCPAKGTERISEITLADFWGVQSEYPEFYDDKGTSLVFVHNQNLISLFSDCCKIKEIDINKGIKHNPSIINSCIKPKKRDSFFEDLKKKDFGQIIKKYTEIPLYKKLFLSGKCCINSGLNIFKVK